MRRRIILAVEKHWKLLVGFPVAGLLSSIFPKLLRDFFRDKLMDWMYERLGSLGQWLLNYPLAGFTIGLSVSLVGLMVMVIREWSVKEVSAIVDPGLRPYETERISRAWTTGLSAFVVITVTMIGYGSFRYYRDKSTPEVIIFGSEAILFRPNTNPFANIAIQNIGGAGKLTVYSFSALSLTTADPVKVREELDGVNKKLVAHGGGLTFYIRPLEKKWFSVMGPPLSSEQAADLKDGKLCFYFSGSIVTTGTTSQKYDFCSFVVGNKPKVILECPELF